MNEAARAPRRDRTIAASVVAAVAVLALVLVSARAASVSFAPERELLASRGTGWLALTALLSSLCTSSLARAGARMTQRELREGTVSIVRRALGVAAGWLALAHAFASLVLSPLRASSALTSSPQLRAGLVALLILLVLLLTSFDAVLRRLRLHSWKELHRLAYVAALLVLQHLVLAPFASRTLTLWAYGLAFAAWLPRLLLR